ncbi:Uma2 family endonuclease [Dehalococcoidia bacterium]|nr:Uma2 family endonuclease [Dehalococcoidia bacterium]
MAEVGIKFTVEDYKNLPESETKRYELLGGELVMVPSPSEAHQSISRNLLFLLWKFVRDNALGVVYHAPFDIVFSEEDIAQPDLIYISNERRGIITPDDVRGAPDLVIEILSPSTAGRDRTYKKTLYARHGVKEYWIVDPKEKTVEVMSLGEEGFETIELCRKGDVLLTRLLEGLAVPLSEVF